MALIYDDDDDADCGGGDDDDDDDNADDDWLLHFLQRTSQRAAAGEEELGRQALKLRELEFQAQKAHKENDTLSQKTQRLQQELEEQINTNNQRQIELKTKDDEIAAVKSQALKDRWGRVCVCSALLLFVTLVCIVVVCNACVYCCCL